MVWEMASEIQATAEVPETRYEGRGFGESFTDRKDQWKQEQKKGN